MFHFLHPALPSVFLFGSANVHFYFKSFFYCVHVSVHVNSLIQPHGKAYNVSDLLTPPVLYVSFYASPGNAGDPGAQNNKGDAK